MGYFASLTLLLFPLPTGSLLVKFSASLDKI